MEKRYSFIVNNFNNIKEELIEKYGISRREYRRLKSSGKVYINNSLAKITTPVKLGDLVEIFIKECTEIIPQPLPLNIIFEDQYLIVLEKDGETLVHPVHNEQLNTLANGLVDYFNKKGESFGIHPVNRLDRETSGLVIFAKNSYIHSLLAKQLENRKIKRQYLAVVEGTLPKEEGVINLPILDLPTSKKVNSEKGKEAITEYKLLKKYENYSLLKLNILTGRTHQIRIHLKALGCGILGDSLYHKKSSLISRQALHAFSLSFNHPLSGEELKFVSELPGDFKTLLNRLTVM
ncbi:RluA family pseudouridine synthase [Anaerobranca gottschalkii]|uniref:Pseudouridine synthase n=1 Tax=Anaerobranca gottschalkii DSM 13577 TaxID=1120990 RepID=A0A1I0CFJ8_9FIRM|nr:RluA family pseudouridine synthase [Anaerobranca gottschalkii]SET18172.1 23S rRNA pseudouridine1911/1915/1917 synthase [Anaerobranca gottschalkii DSM 13577]